MSKVYFPMPISSMKTYSGLTVRPWWVLCFSTLTFYCYSTFRISFTLYPLATRLWSWLWNPGKIAPKNLVLDSSHRLSSCSYLASCPLMFLCSFPLGVSICFCFALICSTYLALFTGIWMRESHLELFPLLSALESSPWVFPLLWPYNSQSLHFTLSASFLGACFRLHWVYCLHCVKLQFIIVVILLK